MPGQYTASLACTCIFFIPWWAPCRSARVWSGSYRGMQMWLLLRRRQWTTFTRHLRSVGLPLGLAACNPAKPLGLGSTVCCTPGCIQWNLEWHPAQLWTIGHAGCFGLWVWGGILCGRGSNLGSQLTPFLYQVCIEWCSHTSVCRGACIEVRKSSVDGLLLDHLQQLMVILYGHMPAI